MNQEGTVQPCLFFAAQDGSTEYQIGLLTSAASENPSSDKSTAIQSSATQANESFSRAQLFGYIALCLIWGSTWLAIRFAVRDLPPFLAAALRFFVAASLLGGVSTKDAGPRAYSNGMRFCFKPPPSWPCRMGCSSGREQHVTSSMTAVLYPPAAGCLIGYARDDALQGAAEGCICHGDCIWRTAHTFLDNRFEHESLGGGLAVLPCWSPCL